MSGEKRGPPPELLPLAEFFAASPSIAVALSGGIDSRFLCHAAQLCGANVLAIHVRGPHIPAAETAWATAWAKKRGLPFKLARFDPLSTPAIASNAKDRCYHCKKGIIGSIAAVLREIQEDHRLICDGSNLDDQKAYRPGMTALAETGVRSPLAEAGFAKSAIRSAAAKTGLELPRQPSRPCLLTRFNYGMRITPPYLTLVERLEGQIKTILAALPNPPDFRLRFCPRPVLHLTAPIPEHEAILRDLLAQNGLPDCSFKLLSTLSGYFDRCESEKAKKDNGSA